MYLCARLTLLMLVETAKFLFKKHVRPMGTAKNSIEQASALYLQDHQSFSVSYELLKFRFHEKLCTEVFGGRDSARVNFAH